jgi:hypothetical protein
MVIKWSMDDSNFNAGLTRINKSMSMLQSQFKATSSKLANFGSETDKLKNKQDYLTKSLDLQKARIDSLNSSYEKSKAETGENSNATQNLAIKLNNAISYYNKLEGELKQTTSELEKQSSKWTTLSKNLETAGSKLQGIGYKMSSAGATLTIGVTAPLLAAGAASFKFASDLQENIGKSQVVFKELSGDVEEWGNTTLKNYGLSKSTAIDMAASYGDMATSMGLTTEQAEQMGKQLVGRAADISSFKNKKIELSNEALTSIFTGETESLKKFGVVMTQANLQQYAYSKGIKTKIEDMSQAEQVMLRYNYVMDKTNNAEGDFSRTGGNAAGQMRTFTESLDELGGTIGTQLLPIFTPVISKANEIIQNFAKLDTGTQQNILKFGAFAIATGPVLSVLGKLTSGIGGTLKFVANLDKNFTKLKTTSVAAANNIKKVGSAMVSGAKAAGTFAVNVGKSAIQLGKQAIQAAASVTKLVAHKIATIATTIATKAFTLAQAALNFVMSLNPLTLIVIGITALVVAIVLLWNKCEWFRDGVKAIWEKIKEIFKSFSDWLDGVFSTDWSQKFGVFGEVLNVFFANAKNIWDAIKEVFNGIIDFVGGVFTGDWSRAWEGVKEIFGGIFDGLEAVAKAPLNAVIGLINMAITALNSISVDIPDFIPGIGGQHFGVNLGKIDYLYTGGIINTPTLLGNTVVGDSYKGMGNKAEAVIPLDSMYRNLRNIVQEESSNQPVYVIVNVANNMDNKAIGKAVTTEVKKEISRGQNNRNRVYGRG